MAIMFAIEKLTLLKIGFLKSIIYIIEKLLIGWTILKMTWQMVMILNLQI